MSLDGRKLFILQAIIEDYINTAEPVGSRTVSKKYLTNVSSATIRNEMADLEDMGYIEQPYTSAGRIPSDKGYRLYVDYLMGQNIVSEVANEYIRKEFMDTLGEIDRLIKHASKLLSNMTRYTSIAIAPQLSRTCLKQIQFIKIDISSILAVLVTDAGIVKNSVIRVDEDMDVETLNKISRIFNENLSGISLEELMEMDLANIDDFYEGLNGYKDIFIQIFPELFQVLKYSNKSEVYHDGASNLLDLPEYNNVERAKEFLSILEENDLLFQILSDATNDLSVTIGGENKVEQLKNCSLITTTYSINGRTIGSIGVLGPTRMEYSKVISIVDSLTYNLNSILSKILNG